MHTNYYGDDIARKTRPRFSPEFKVESAQLVLDQGYSVREAAEAMGVGKSTLDKWVRKLKSERDGTLTEGRPITEEQRKIAELEKRIKRLELEKDILRPLHDEEKNTVNNAVKYANYALGQFIEAARKSNYWQDTVFLVVAVHNSRVYGADVVPVDRFHVPAVVLGGSIDPGVFKPVASQIDLGPTMLSLIGISSVHPMIGRDLTRPEMQAGPGRAIMQFNATQAYMEGDSVIVLRKDMPAAEFRYKEGKLLLLPRVNQSLLTKALAHSAWSSIAYDQKMYRMGEVVTQVTSG